MKKRFEQRYTVCTLHYGKLCLSYVNLCKDRLIAQRLNDCDLKKQNKFCEIKWLNQGDIMLQSFLQQILQIQCRTDFVISWHNIHNDQMIELCRLLQYFKMKMKESILINWSRNKYSSIICFHLWAGMEGVIASVPHPPSRMWALAAWQKVQSSEMQIESL